MHTYIGKTLYTQGFYYWEEWGKESHPTSKIAHSRPPPPPSPSTKKNFAKVDSSPNFYPPHH